MRIIFAGTPQFAVPFLDALTKSTHQILAVYTQPDKPAGRGLHLTSSPIKQQALHYNLPIYQLPNFLDTATQRQLQQLNADLLIDVAYGVLLPKSILSAPRYGCVNVHPSLLPRWRGAAPIQRAILTGDTATGVTIMQMNEGLDTGDILQQKSISIENTDTTATLSDKLIKLGIDLLLDTLEKISTNSCRATAQNNQLSTYAAKITKEEAKIHWPATAIEIDRMIRAFNPQPIAYCTVAKQTVRVWQAVAVPQKSQNSPGTIIAANANGIDIATGNGILRLTQLQFPGKKVLPAKDILNAHADLFKLGNELT